MKVKLTNFKCYTEKEFEFPDVGLTLICGMSGKGKSSCLQAIYFVLYGSGNKLISYGKKSCKVELITEELHIIRTKGPNRLVINEIHEDEVAQCIINERYGLCYNITGYIAQSAVNSFIMMSPVDKLSFLEKFTFNNVNLQEIKNRSKELIKERNEQLIKDNSQMELVNAMINELKDPGEYEFPLSNCPVKYKCGEEGVEYRNKMIKNEHVRLKNEQTHIKKTCSMIKKTENEMKAIEILETKNNTYGVCIDTFIVEIDKLKIEKTNINYEGDDKVKEYEKLYNDFVSYRKITSIKESIERDEKNVEEMKNNEMNEYKEKLINIEKKLWKEYNEKTV